ncbi:hypothetical protein FA95DRAFT_1612156 [Auriscalpium vulgare]|uniref:Uncharacterized protein n=1 Tax=Auriscalpium vulgare TaxID=40419 RepID=A0ACB8R7C6_9AGAM|nr:hypothetical protein FA95DRAFT_1612156 [Auriscalpium vulgare]
MNPVPARKPNALTVSPLARCLARPAISVIALWTAANSVAAQRLAQPRPYPNSWPDPWLTHSARHGLTLRQPRLFSRY